MLGKFIRMTAMAGTAAMSIAASSAAFAQTMPGQSAATDDSAGDIVVTARRREEALQDVPISVSAISGAQLERAGVTDVQGLQYRTPSLSITSGQSQRNTVAFALRGQRSQETQLFTDPPVGTYFAEVVQPRPYGFGKSFYDLQSVQVLKGVQGTLFGRNMTGGAVLVEPMHPKLGEYSGQLTAQYGNYDMRDLYGYLNAPLGEKAAVRVAGKIRRRDGWAHEVTSGRDYDNQRYDTFRGSLLFEPFEGFETLTIGDWYKSNEHGTAAFATALYQPSVINNYEAFRAAGRIATNIPAQFAAAQALFRQRRFSFDIGSGDGGNLDISGIPYEKIKNWGITNKTTWELSDTMTLKNIFGYRKLRRDQVQDYDGLPAFIINPVQYARTKNISEELQLQGKAFDSKLDYILGGYYFEEKGLDGSQGVSIAEINLIARGLNPNTTPASFILTQNPGRGYARTAAGFAAGTFHATEQLSVSGGLRYNYDKRHITVTPLYPNLNSITAATAPGNTAAAIAAAQAAPACLFDIDAATAGLQTVPVSQCSFTNQKSFKEWTYDATVQWEPSAAVTTYASYRHGFRAGGFSTRATSYVAFAPFKPEFVNEYEIGLKTNSRIGNARLTTSTAIFRQDGSDVQKQRSTFVNGNVFTVIDNTAKQRNSGGEFEATLSVPNFSLTGFYSYTKVKILAGGGTINLATATGPVVLNEIAQRGNPKHQIGGTATISPPTNPDFGKLNVIANVTWRSKIYLDDFEVQGIQPAYSLVNLRAELNEIGGSKASVALFANNLLDKTYRIGVLGLIAEGLGFNSSVYGEPQMYGVEVSYKF